MFVGLVIRSMLACSRAGIANQPALKIEFGCNLRKFAFLLGFIIPAALEGNGGLARPAYKA